LSTQARRKAGFLLAHWFPAVRSLPDCRSTLGYIVSMKPALIFIFAALLLAPRAAPQVVSDDIKEPLFFVKTTTAIYGHIRHLSPHDFLAIYIAPENWSAASKDGDLAPFLDVKDARTKKARYARSATCIFSPEKEMGLCVYFDGETPFGVATARVGVNGRIDAERVARSYQGVSKEMLKESRQKLNFTPTEAVTDDGQALPAWVITTQ
jgi:hypothetical protein